jgi:drug/metabolite transporter (DMT)-like permease
MTQIRAVHTGSNPRSTWHPKPRSPILVLAIALLGIAVAAPLIRLSHDPPLTIAVWRLGFSLLIIVPFLIRSRGWRQWPALTRDDVMIAIAAGVFLALHFWSWNASIFYTSVAASVVLVNTQPIIVALLSAIWLKEMPTPVQWSGITLAVAGACIVGWGDFSRTIGPAAAGNHALLGDGLALLGGIAVAIYYVAGRRLRGTLDLWAYVALVYSVCFVTLVGIALATATPLWPQPPREFAIFAALAIGPMLLGHTGLNWALKYLPAYLVVLTVLGEPIGATLLAAILPGIRETPSASTFLGGIVLLAGIAIAAMSRQPPPLPVPGSSGS